MTLGLGANIEQTTISLAALYGYFSMDARRYCRTTICSERYMDSAKDRAWKNVFQVTLLGAFEPLPPKKKKRKRRWSGAKERMDRVQLLYALTRHRPEAPIANCLQVSASILSKSRIVFLGLLLKMLRSFDARKLECLYMDTDSIHVCTESPDLVDAIRPELKHRADEIMRELMSDPSSVAHQGGKLKVVGRRP